VSRCVCCDLVAITPKRDPPTGAPSGLERGQQRGQDNELRALAVDTDTPAITHSSFELCSAPSKLVASLRPRLHVCAGPSGLDRACAQLAKGNCVLPWVSTKQTRGRAVRNWGSDAFYRSEDPPCRVCHGAIAAARRTPSAATRVSMSAHRLHQRSRSKRVTVVLNLAGGRPFQRLDPYPASQSGSWRSHERSIAEKFRNGTLAVKPIYAASLCPVHHRRPWGRSGANPAERRLGGGHPRPAPSWATRR
jgi:hypothetical protein